MTSKTALAQAIFDRLAEYEKKALANGTFDAEGVIGANFPSLASDLSPGQMRWLEGQITRLASEEA